MAKRILAVTLRYTGAIMTPRPVSAHTHAALKRLVEARWPGYLCAQPGVFGADGGTFTVVRTDAGFIPADDAGAVQTYLQGAADGLEIPK